MARRSVRIAVHVEEGWTSLHHYCMGPISERWRARGLAVEVIPGWRRTIDADVAFLHIDRTVLSDEICDHLAARYPVLINGAVRDISKRTISDHIVKDPADYDGPVIVKSNLNSGGMLEQRIDDAGSGLARRLWLKAYRRLPWALTGHVTAARYQAFATPRQVPSIAWTDPGIVVEKFFSEREGDLYFVRHWLFLGDRNFSFLRYSADPIVKSETVVKVVRSDVIPNSLLALRDRFGFDYGKFDFVITENGPIVFDINRTPGLSRDPPNPYLAELAVALDSGLEYYIQR